MQAKTPNQSSFNARPLHPPQRICRSKSLLQSPEQYALLLLAIERDLPRAISVFPATASIKAQTVVDLMFKVSLPAKQVIVEQGKATDRMFVIESGQCGVYSNDFANQPAHFEIMKTAGESFGLFKIEERLLAELQTDVSLRVDPTNSPDKWTVSGRGELHLLLS